MNARFPIKKSVLVLLIFFSGIFGLALTFLLYAFQPGIPENTLPTSGILQLSKPSPLPPAPPFSSVNIVTYNIGYGSGRKNNQGSILTRKEVEENLKQISKAIKKLHPDIVFLQEVDFHSARTFYINELNYLAERLGLSFAAYVLTWNKNYVAWPYWPPSRHFGRLVSGQAVLSRFPILSQRVTIFDKPPSNPFWYNWFYLDRKAQTVKIRMGNQTWSLFQVHLEAFDPKQREKQLNQLVTLVRQPDTPFKILGGDFNLAWEGTGAPQEEVRENREQLKIFSQKSGLSMAGWKKHFLTFPSWQPDMRIDYIFFSDSFRLEDVGNLTTILGSDHLPVWARLRPVTSP